MKPRTYFERQIVYCSEELSPLTKKQYDWAVEHCFPKTGYTVKNGAAWCHQCGTVFTSTELPKLKYEDTAEAICPVCGRKIKVSGCRQQHYSEDVFFTILTTIKDFQVCRHFEIIKRVHKGEPASYYVNEVIQNWIDEKGRERVLARSMTISNYMYRFIWSSDLTLKSLRGWGGSRITDYDINACFTYPERKILPILRRNGYDARFQKLAPNILFKLLLTDNKAESLLKMKRFDLLELRYTNSYDYEKYRSSVKVMLRHHYKPTNLTTWFDYIHMCDELGMDIHNPIYVCPKKLKTAHDTVLLRLQKKRQKERSAREREENQRRILEAIKYEENYKKEKGMFFGICFEDKNLEVRAIGSVAEMAEEGNAMHHCVFRCGYYKKPESLILSAKDKKGERIETIEVNLKTYEIVQSRGVCNQSTPYHDEILKLVNDNMKLIKQANKNKMEVAV